LALIVATLAPSMYLVLPERAEAKAAVPVFETAIFKEGLLDAIAWAAAKSLLSMLMNMIVQWVRTGNGNIAEMLYGGIQNWILNFEQYLQDAANHAAGIFIGELLGPTVQNALCSPFRIPLVDYFRNTYGNGFPPFPHARCTLTQVISNIDDYHVDYYNGGTDAFLNTWLIPSNNPIGAIIVETQRLEYMANRRAADAELESQSNQGFIGVKKCVEFFDESTIGGDPVKRCVKYETVTPGKAIQDQLAEALKSELKGFQHADEISEVIAQFIVALASALIERGLNEGLSGGGGSGSGAPYSGFSWPGGDFMPGGKSFFGGHGLPF